MNYNYPKKLCIALDLRFQNDFVDSRGIPTLIFLKKIAQSIGGVKGYSTMDINSLPPAISSRLGLKFDKDSRDVSGNVTPAWFNSVIPSLENFFFKFKPTPEAKRPIQFEDFIGSEGEKTRRLLQHIKREQKIVKKLKDQCTDRDQYGFINCCCCRVAPGARHGVEVIEAHHIIPISQAGKRVPKLEDFLLLCPNCHSSVHAGAKIDITPENNP